MVHCVYTEQRYTYRRWWVEFPSFPLLLYPPRTQMKKTKIQIHNLLVVGKYANAVLPTHTFLVEQRPF